MKKKTISGLIVIAAIVMVAMFAGCIEDEKISASDDINISVSLMNSGATRIEKIDLEAGEYSDAKAKLTASKVDYEEAFKILNNATTDYDEEKKIIETNKIICSYSLDDIDALQNITICLEHLDKASAYIESDDIASFRSELKLAEDALNDASSFIFTAKEKCFSIDIDTVPIESKSEILENRISIEQNEKMISENGEIISGMYPFADGMENMLKAIDYINNEDWHSAELEFGYCSPDFSKSKDTFNNLKNSEFTEVSVPAIEMYGILSKLLEALPHFEAGCRYASKGNFNKAEDEFNKIPEF
jgi:outer membrane murein-binding lipoprotein Lpp